MTAATVITELEIPAPPARVAAAIASPQALGTWLCDEATSERRLDGALTFKWHDGQRREGHWTTYNPPTGLAWRWRIGFDGPTSMVSFDLDAVGGATLVTVTRTDVPPEQVSAISALWRDYLADLATYLASGANGRLARRPMLGISPAEVNAELVAKHGLKVDHGILLEGFTDDSPAAAAGFRAGDVVVQVGSHPARDWAGLVAALNAQRAGDVVPVTAWRGGEMFTAPVTLAGRPQTPAPANGAEARALVRQQVGDMAAGFADALAGVTDAEGDFRPAPDAWTIREVLAHLGVSERLGHDDLARLATDSDPVRWAFASFDLRQRVVATVPLAELMARYAADLRETEALVLAALDEADTPAMRGLLAQHVTFGRSHADDHLAQIRANRAAAREAQVVAPVGGHDPGGRARDQ